MSAPVPHSLHQAILAGHYELAALRMLHGLLVTLQETAPEAREALLDEIARWPRRGGER